MFTFLAIVHVVVSIFMIAFILLQDPKGGGGALGMLGSGSSKSLFGNTGGNQFLVNVTKWMAVIFAFTSLYLAALSSEKDKSVMDEYTESNAPSEKSNKDVEKTQSPPKEGEEAKKSNGTATDNSSGQEPEDIENSAAQEIDKKNDKAPKETQPIPKEENK